MIHKGVYDTGPDTLLQIEHVSTAPSETILDIGCGAGVATILLARRSSAAVGVDINPHAVSNAKENARRLGARNVRFLESNALEMVSGKFDIIVCNPPYSDHPTSDRIDMMFWDSANSMKRDVLRHVHEYLAPGGRFYFGTSNFGDLPDDEVDELTAHSGLRRSRAFWVEGRHDRKFGLIEFVNLDSVRRW